MQGRLGQLLRVAGSLDPDLNREAVSGTDAASGKVSWRIVSDYGDRGFVSGGDNFGMQVLAFIDNINKETPEFLVDFVALTAPEVWGEHLDGDQGIALADGRDGAREQASAVVEQVVAGHGREHHIAQAQADHRFGHPFGFGAIHGAWCLSFVHLAKGAAAGADRAAQQEGGGAAGITLAPVRTAALLADRVQPLLLHHRLHPFQIAGSANRHPQPGRQALGRGDGAIAAGAADHGWAASGVLVSGAAV